jgi:hypothetical protein
MNTEPLMIRKSTHDFAMLIASQLAVAGLAGEVETHFLAEKQEVIPALRRGFLLPGSIPLPAVPVEMAGYPIEETDCFTWLGHMEQFATAHFGGGAQPGFLSRMFPLPARLPWKKVLPIFDPGLTNREMVDKALKSQGLSVGEYADVSGFSGSGSEGPRLWLVERSAVPTAAGGLPPKFAKQWFEGRQTRPLNLRAYGIGTALWYNIERKFLDPEAKTATWFPESGLPDGHVVACGYCGPADYEVWFSQNDRRCERGRYGFREAILRLPKNLEPCFFRF